MQNQIRNLVNEESDKMERASILAAKLIQELATVIQRLGERDIVVSSFHCDWGSSWTILAQQGAATDKYLEVVRGPNPLQATGPDVLRCSWDDRDHLLVVDRSPSHPLCSPDRWTREKSRTCYDVDEAMGWAEKFLSERLEKMSN